jgi:hypothetical protein
MKYLFLILTVLGLAFAMPTPTFAQAGTDTVQVDVTKLTDDQLRVYRELKAMQAKAAAANLTLNSLTPETVDKYSQMGKSIGIAINEGLGAVTKNVEQFSQTSAGKWLMVIITWKVMGEDAINVTQRLVRFVVGIGLLTLGVPFFIYIFRRNCVSQPMLVSRTKVVFLTVKKEYIGMTQPIHDDAGPWGYAVCFAAFVGICSRIMFM